MNEEIKLDTRDRVPNARPRRVKLMRDNNKEMRSDFKAITSMKFPKAEVGL